MEGKAACGPRVRLMGTQEDWTLLQQKVAKLGEYGLGEWSRVLHHVLQHFVDAYDVNAKKDTNFWNRIATQTSRRSGPSYLTGWILAFCPFDRDGNYVLNSLDTIQKTHDFGKMDTNEIPTCLVEFPVIIDDQGTIHNTVIIAGSLMTQVHDDQVKYPEIGPALGWVLVDLK